MPITITMKSNLSLQRSREPQMVLASSVQSVNDLLRYLGERIDFVFLDAASGRLRPDIEVIVNGKEIWFYPEGLQKPIHDGDSIEVTLIPLGGG
jgi:1-acyl-sn-glycerol-3-phosphate acyltransferase